MPARNACFFDTPEDPVIQVTPIQVEELHMSLRIGAVAANHIMNRVNTPIRRIAPLKKGEKSSHASGVSGAIRPSFSGDVDKLAESAVDDESRSSNKFDMSTMGSHVDLWA